MMKYKSEEQTCNHICAQERNECWCFPRPTGGKKQLPVWLFKSCASLTSFERSELGFCLGNKLYEGIRFVVIIIIIIIWCFILCERQFFYKNSLALRTNQSKSHNITIYILH